MGLAFDINPGSGDTPFWQTLAEGNKLATPEMSFWLTRHIGDPNAQEEEFGGVFTLGGQNKTLYKGDVEFLPLVTNAGRQVYLDLSLTLSHLRASISGVTVNNKAVTLPSGGVAAFDTGTTLLGGPSAAVSAIYAQIPNSQPLSGGRYGFRMSLFYYLSLLLTRRLHRSLQYQN